MCSSDLSGLGKPVPAFGVEGGGSGVRVAVAAPAGGSVRPATGGRLAGAAAFGLGATFAGRACCGGVRRPGGILGGCATRGACRAIGGFAVCCFAVRFLSFCWASAAAALNASRAVAMESTRPDSKPGRMRVPDHRDGYAAYQSGEGILVGQLRPNRGAGKTQAG